MPRAVYVAALNRVTSLAALGEALHRPPYHRPPQAPVLHLKPANTWIGPGDPIPCPRGASHLRMGGTIGLLIGRRIRRLAPAAALECVAGYAICNDVSLPYESHYRPAIKERCRDGFCPIGSAVPTALVSDLDRLELVIEINGVVRSRSNGLDLVRSPGLLLSEVSRFITFVPGDLVLLGEPFGAPLAAPGDTVRIAVEDLGVLENPIVAVAA